MRVTTTLEGLLGGAIFPVRDGEACDLRHGHAEHEHAFGGLPEMTDPHWLDRQVRMAGLTGRGGAHFPVGTKMAASRAASVNGWTLVANGAEGEPASGKDAALLQLRPHLILDGALVATAMIGARRVVIWLAEQAPLSVRSMQLAIAERASSPGPRPEIVTTAERYLSGESSAIIRAVQGGPALPRTTFEPGRSWAGGPPVLVHNVETLARLGLLARTGAGFHEPSSLVTVTDRDRRLVVEVPGRERFGEVFSRVGVPAPQAVLLGGYGGEWVSWEELAGLRVDPQGLRASGRSLGAGVLLALPRGHCGLRATAPIAAWLAGESAGQCGPCRFGLPAIADLTTRLAGRPRRRDLGRLRELLGLVDRRGACRLPDGAVRMLRSALQTFAAEVELHRRGQCTARDGRR